MASLTWKMRWNRPARGLSTRHLENLQLSSPCAQQTLYDTCSDPGSGCRACCYKDQEQQRAGSIRHCSTLPHSPDSSCNISCTAQQQHSIAETVHHQHIMSMHEVHTTRTQIHTNGSSSVPVTDDIGRLWGGTSQVGNALTHSQDCLPDQLDVWVCCTCHCCCCALNAQPSTGAAEQCAITGCTRSGRRLASDYHFSQSLHSSVSS